MKIAALFLFFNLLGLSCSNAVVEPVEFAGSWKLFKVSYGFPPPNSPGFTTSVEDEVYAFDSSNSTFSFVKNGKETEAGKFNLTEDANNPNGKKIIQFLTNNTFSNYTFSADNKELTLYQRSGFGGILADGSTFHYKKVE
jgi:hypothetical protein